MSEGSKPHITALAVQLLSAYVGRNAVPSCELAKLIRTTKTALAEEEQAENSLEPEHTPAVSLSASLASPEHILSMIDGKPYKSLTRHLTARGLTAEEYRVRYKLPGDYPMVAPAYAERRRVLAKQSGLGGKKKRTSTAPEAPSDTFAAPAKAKQV